MDPRFEWYKDTRGHFRWHLKAANGNVIASSGDKYYTTRDAVLQAIQQVKTSVADARAIQTTATLVPSVPQNDWLTQHRKIMEKQARLNALSRRNKINRPRV
jgi:uncharacterized protein YegP (UPF0339 family)